MRKLIGFCVVLGIAAGGIGWLAHRGYLKVEIDLSPRHVACSRCCADSDPALPDDLPTEPTPIEPGPVAVAGIIDLPPLPTETAPIVIPDSFAAAAEPVAEEAVAPAIYKGWPSAPQSAEAPVASKQMPYCAEADLATPPMPYDDEANSLQTRTEVELGAMLQEMAMKRLVELVQTHGIQLSEDEEECDDSQSCPRETHKGMPPAHTTANDSTPLGATPPCEEDRHHHQHYPGCPHAGHCPYSGGHYYPVIRPVIEPTRRDSEPAPLPAGGEEEAEEPPMKKEPGPVRHQSMKPRENLLPPGQPVVDTMEYRRTDGRLDDYGPGPF